MVISCLLAKPNPGKVVMLKILFEWFKALFCVHSWERMITAKSELCLSLLLTCPKCGKLKRWDFYGKEVSDPNVIIKLGEPVNPRIKS